MMRLTKTALIGMIALCMTTLSVVNTKWLSTMVISTPIPSTGEQSPVPSVLVNYSALITRHSLWTGPEQVLQEYISMHSAQALQRDTERFDRKYIIAPYSCPYQTGVMTADFLNALVIGIITNRTILWEHRKSAYWQESNTMESCNEIAPPASWIAHVDQVLHPSTPRVETYSCQDYSRLTKDALSRNETGLVHVYTNEPIVVHNRCWNVGGNAQREELHQRRRGWFGRLFLEETAVQFYVAEAYGVTDFDIVRAMYRHGVDYLYGFLWERAIELKPTVIQSVNKALERVDETAITIGFHSRHPEEADDGSNVTAEVECLEKILHRIVDSTSSKMPCQILAMADRPATLQALEAWANTVGCTVLTSHPLGDILDHDYANVSDSNVLIEQGPWTGAAFYEDAVLVAQAQHGFVGGQRSSSQLVSDWITYRVYQKAFSEGRETPPILHKCIF